MGGSFSISNLGMYGLAGFSAIINPPQGVILAVGGGQEAASLPGGPGSGPKFGSFLTATLSADNRVVDGEAAARFLAAFAGYMANPVTMLV
jgi:pyruvate dehydrogenase E2 component (dihydrolipoamide acetyltransferase)